MGDYKQDKILICISSVMVWSATPPKEKKQGEEAVEGEDEGGEDEPDSEAEAENEKVADDEAP